VLTIIFAFIFYNHVSYIRPTFSGNLQSKSEYNLKLWYNSYMRKQHEHPIVLADKKQCTKCKNFKLFSDFHKFAKSPDGYKHFCKTCVREYDLAENDPKRVMPRKMQGTKIHCRKCEQYLPKSSFWSKNTYCKTCQPLIGHISNLKKYNLTRDDYVDLEKSQNGVCKICGEPEKYKNRLSIDHDHSCCPGYGSCGKCIRGLLCHHCNSGLGNAKDSVEILQKMINYLQK
jgi:hypothetical protein